jgi:hypothetical protein
MDESRTATSTVGTSEVFAEEPTITVEAESGDALANVPQEGENEEEAVTKDAADKIVAMIVHFALAFFVVLAAVASFLAITLVTQFGFLAFMIVFLLLIAVCGIAWFVDHVMQEDAKWKPVRKQIRHWKAVATQVVLNEVRMFQLDWNEHLLLTDGKSDYDLYGDDDDDDDIPAAISKAAKNKDKPKQNRGKSVLFKLVKPFLKVGGRRRRKRQEKEAAAQSAAAATDSYVPPIV